MLFTHLFKSFGLLEQRQFTCKRVFLSSANNLNFIKKASRALLYLKLHKLLSTIIQSEFMKKKLLKRKLSAP